MSDYDELELIMTDDPILEPTTVRQYTLKGKLMTTDQTETRPSDEMTGKVVWIEEVGGEP